MTKSFHTFAVLAALACGTALADEAPAQAMYIRGAFNGWGADAPLLDQGQGIFVADIVIGPGWHGFKVGSKDWAREWVIDPAASVNIALDAPYPLVQHGGAQDYLLVKQSGAYRFSIDVSHPGAAQLRISRLGAPASDGTDAHLGHAARQTLDFTTFDGRTESAQFSAPDASAALRGYAQSSTMQLRDPGAQSITYQETADQPRVRSANLAFDALFALALTEMKQDAVSQIQDGNYNGGAAIACDCFETGERWHYVWTRDLSYAAKLGLAMLDPQRTRNALAFKLSPWRVGATVAAQVAGSAAGLQIVQDTGSGGSWPVSTDRVSWAFGAEEVLNMLAPAERAAFAQQALTALENTIENDRLAAFDGATGLYMGEQSFLDWREQSYAAWIVTDLAALASSKALSTNVAHYKALTLAAELAREQGKAALSKKYQGWADALKKAINARLWLSGAGMYSGLTASRFDGAPMVKFDWLGQALAIITGVADEGRAQEILANYPHGPMGAPVIYPQQADVPVYHNRAIWPFVTAFGLRAAAASGNVSVADAAYDTLMRGAALNLSNMENLEWLSAQPLLLDEAKPALTGPVINSRRQLWSVAGYLGMVIGNVFGVSTSRGGIEIRPFITSRLRRTVFGQADVIALKALRLREHTLNINVKLPKATAVSGYFAVETIFVNGKRAASPIRWEQLGSDNLIEVVLGELLEGQQGIKRVRADPFAQGSAVFGPPEPVLGALAHDARGRTRLLIAPTDRRPNTVFNIYRDGALVAARVGGASWTDSAATPTACYALEAQFVDSGNRSHHSAPRCNDEGMSIAVGDARIASNVQVAGPNERFAAQHLPGWGKPSDTFTVRDVRIARTGLYQIELEYHNSANQINLGISAGVKWLTLRDHGGRVVAQGVIALPHTAAGAMPWQPAHSTALAARLRPGSYLLEASDFYNMSYLQSNSSFGAAGGVDGPMNQVDIFGVRVRAAK
ncbi:MAG: esterase [Pseudomonadota bacterium]